MAETQERITESKSGKHPRVVAEYRYPQAVKLRFENKSFCWKHWDGSRMVSGRGDIPHSLYHAEQIEESDTVWLAEGEKDADTLCAMGLCGVSTEDGASRNGQKPKWYPEYGEQLRGSHVVILNDNDEPGRAHASACADQLLDIAASVRRIEMTDLWDAVPEKGDISDMAAAFGLEETKEMLLAKLERAAILGNPKEQEDKNPVWKALGIPPMHDTGDWIIREEGLAKKTKDGGTAFFSSTPIVPIAIYANRDTGEHEIRLRAICRGKLTEFTSPQRVLASNQKIVEELSKHGVDVNTNTARYMTSYFSTMLNAENDIPCVTSVNHLGWVDEDFLPYCEAGKVQFASEDIDRSTYEAVCSQKGTLKEWVDFVAPLRQDIRVRLIMAASFASPLIALVHAQPFILHLWGTTGIGKTVVLRLAMSIWGDPEDNGLLHTTNNTLASMCITASMLQNLPFAADELQLIKARNGGNYDSFIMSFCEGIERGRANQNAEKRRQRTWKSCALVTGEEPITGANSGGGAKNRTLEIKCNEKLFPDGGEVVRFLRNHHGTAGRRFIRFVQEIGHEELTALMDILTDSLRLVSATDKQKAAAVLCMLGDELARLSLFPQEQQLKVSDVARFLKSDVEVRTSERAKGFITDWIAANAVHFPSATKDYHAGNGRQALCIPAPRVDMYGIKADDSTILINYTQITSALKEEGYTLAAVADDWLSDGFLERCDRRSGVDRNQYRKQVVYYIKPQDDTENEMSRMVARFCILHPSPDWTNQADNAEDTLPWQVNPPPGGLSKSQLAESESQIEFFNKSSESA